MTNFTVIYIKMGFPRLPPERQSSLIPALLQSLVAKPGSHQDSLLAMILPMLGDVKPPENEEKKKAFLGLGEKPAVRKLFLDYLSDYLLLPYGSHPSLSFTDENGEEIKPKVPAGMCDQSWKRIAGIIKLIGEIRK